MGLLSDRFRQRSNAQRAASARLHPGAAHVYAAKSGRSYGAFEPYISSGNNKCSYLRRMP